MLKGVAGVALALVMAAPVAAQSFDAAVFAKAKAVQPKVVAWRRDIHEHPELGNSEVRTGTSWSPSTCASSASRSGAAWRRPAWSAS